MAISARALTLLPHSRTKTKDTKMQPFIILISGGENGMPTFNQLVKQGRKTAVKKSTAPAPVSYTHLSHQELTNLFVYILHRRERLALVIRWLVVMVTRVSFQLTSYNLVNGIYTNENPWLLKDVLRKTWGFNGMVVSDWSAAQ